MVRLNESALEMLKQLGIEDGQVIELLNYSELNGTKVSELQDGEILATTDPYMLSRVFGHVKQGDKFHAFFIDEDGDVVLTTIELTVGKMDEYIKILADCEIDTAKVKEIGDLTLDMLHNIIEEYEDSDTVELDRKIYNN